MTSQEAPKRLACEVKTRPAARAANKLMQGAPHARVEWCAEACREIVRS